MFRLRMTSKWLHCSVRTKLAALLSVLSLVLVASIMGVIKVSFDRGFQTYLNETTTRHLVQLAEQITLHAQAPHEWDRFISTPAQWDAYFREFRQRQSGQDMQIDGRPPPPAGLRPPRFQQGDDGPALHKRPPPPGGGRPVWLLDRQYQVIFGPPMASAALAKMLKAPILRAGQPIAYVTTPGAGALADAADRVYAEQQHRLFWWIAVIAVLVSIVLSWPLSWYLVSPVQRLSRAMHALKDRQYDQRVPVSTSDELGVLAQDFNQMAQTLQHHDQQQRQWLADVSHELRTPLSVLAGELEAVEDGVMPLDINTVASFKQEVSQLTRLVDDLHLLAITQASLFHYRFTPVDFYALLKRLQPRLQQLLQTAGLTFEIKQLSDPVMIMGDEQRLEQLIVNLAQNSARYTDRGGHVRLSLHKLPLHKLSLQKGHNVVLKWEDSAPGVLDEDLPHLFDRFYRVEHSRQRALGGSGLGLSIVANIVQAHGAVIHAAHSTLGGLAITIEFGDSKD